MLIVTAQVTPNEKAGLQPSKSKLYIYIYTVKPWLYDVLGTVKK